MVDVDQLVDDLADVIHGTIRAVVSSADGLPLAWSAGLPEDRATQLAALTAGIAAVTAGAADLLDGGGMQATTIEMAGGTLVLTPLPGGSRLAVLTLDE